MDVAPLDKSSWNASFLGLAANARKHSADSVADAFILSVTVPDGVKKIDLTIHAG